MRKQRSTEHAGEMGRTKFLTLGLYKRYRINCTDDALRLRETAAETERRYKNWNLSLQ